MLTGTNPLFREETQPYPTATGTVTGTGGTIPASLLTGTAGNLASMLAGNLPPDVMNLIQQRGAEAGVASGLPGSGIMQNRTLRDLGLTSLDQSNMATKMLLPFFSSPLQTAELAFRESQGQRQSPTPGQASGPWMMPENRPPLLQQPSRPEQYSRPIPSPFTGNVGQPDVGMELMKKYGPGAGFGMAPMGSGTIPSYGGSWNAGALDVGGGSMFMGDPSQLSPEELFAYGLDQPVTSPMSADEADYLYGDTAQFAPVGDEDISYFGG